MMRSSFLLIVSVVILSISLSSHAAAPINSPSMAPIGNAPSPSEIHSPAMSPTINAPAPIATGKSTPAPSPPNHNSPAPPPHHHHSGSTRLSGYVGISVAVALALGSFAY